MSSFITLHPISQSVKAFTVLCSSYSPDWCITRADKMKCDKSVIQVISQFAKDLTEAQSLGIPTHNTFQAKDYYQTTNKTHLKMH